MLRERPCMETLLADDLTIVYAPEDRAAAEDIRAACAASAHLIRQQWGLSVPSRCRLAVLTSPEGFLRDTPPPRWRFLFRLLAPLLMRRMKRLWPVAGGWTLRIGAWHLIGIKPPRLIAEADRSLGERLFVREQTPEEKTWHLTCHELTHACSGHLRLPIWLHEGLAMLTVDRLLGRQTVRADSLTLLRQAPQIRLKGYGTFQGNQREAVARLYARGYWLVRYLDEHQPDLLRGWLARRQPHRAIENRLAQTLGLPRRELWPAVDAFLVAYYNRSGFDRPPEGGGSP